MRPLAILLLAAFPALAADTEATLVVVVPKSLPAIESVSVYRSADFKPGQAKPKPIRTAKLEKGGKDVTLTFAAEPVHVFVKPRDGIEVVVAEKLAAKDGKPIQLNLADRLGMVEVFQKDGFAKVERIVLTAPDDAGPDEKGHVAIQTGSDYRVEMPVPDGFYAVWLVPANGARAIRIEDRIRVLPGKIVRIGN